MHNDAENHEFDSGMIRCCICPIAFIVGKLNAQKAVASTNINGAFHGDV
jgi:hypothetical protein